MNKVVRERFKGMERALKLQAKEYERRLDALNHEADRITASQEKSISVEKFEGVINQINEKFDQTTAMQGRQIKSLEEKASKYEGRSAWTEKYIPWGIVVILMIITVLLSYYQIRREI